ncbi:flagellar hook-associated protein FlgK [Oceanobacillus sp. FSL H7-0719]|uniref:flagellar hook-associated protein FlgK n=1 Tax=Oceanobacillus sp. FSL H7-0719 TaxID=2954507 RepID=UPI00324551DB
MSTFHGLEMAKQALFTQQAALYTTGHNIANANTEGYTRQRVNFEANSAFPAAGRNRPEIPGQIGTGVKAGSVQRIRDEFLDVQFRGENSLAGYWEKRAESLGRMESLMNELNDTGLSKSMDDLWGALQDLAVNPTNSGARSVVVQRGIALADTFNYYNNSLSKIRSDLKGEIDVTVQSANTILKQVDSLNEEIKKLEVNGYVTNDLYDQRDVLIDRLSEIMDIDVEYTPSSDYANELTQGLATIKTNGITLVDPENGANEISVELDSNENHIQEIQVIGNNGGPIEIPQQQGTLQSLIEAYGYEENGVTKGDFVEMQNTLADIAKQFVKEFNEVHASGIDLVEGKDTISEFFVMNDGVMSVNQEIIDDPNLIAASDGTDGAAGDGSNALKLAGVFDDPLSFEGASNTSVKDYYGSVIGSLAVRVQEANRMSANTGVLLSQVASQRQAVSSVSLDEEMTNMIKFQHAYNAAARSMTATDELLDRIINNLGLVGR